MRAILYRYPHPYDSSLFIYVGQQRGRDRDIRHRKGYEGFGKRFKKQFPDVVLPQPIREEVEVQDYSELNELETIWMFRYHTWCGYPDGMNLSFPGSLDYQNIAAMGRRARSTLSPERLSEIAKRVSAAMSKEERSRRSKEKMSSLEVRELYSKRSSEQMLSVPVEERIERAKHASAGLSYDSRSELGKRNACFLHTPEAKEKTRSAHRSSEGRKNNTTAQKKRWENLTSEEKEQKQAHMREVQKKRWIK